MKDVMMPGLAMTRSFGDKAGIKAGTNAEPELLEHTIENCDKLLVIASDGIWEYMENEDVMKAILPGYMKEDLQHSGESLLKRSVDMWAKMNFARDDITFIIVKLSQPEK
jgi:serine/threonine protein phosphatase PrpC